MEVTLLRWPAEAARGETSWMSRPETAPGGGRGPAPESDDCMETGCGSPRRTLTCAFGWPASAGGRPSMPPCFPLSMSTGCCAAGGPGSLPPVEARLTTALLDRFGGVVSRDHLAGAGWPAGAGP